MRRKLEREKREAQLHDAVMAAAARDKTSDETGRPRDSLRAIVAIVKAGWRLRRTEKAREDEDRDR